jgi:hypothetical protein
VTLQAEVNAVCDVAETVDGRDVRSDAHGLRAPVLRLRHEQGPGRFGEQKAGVQMGGRRASKPSPFFSAGRVCGTTSCPHAD